VTPQKNTFNGILNVSGVQELIFRTEGISLSDAEQIACKAIEAATGKRGIKSYNMTAEINMVNQVLNILTGILVSISAVCILCGGIGVMNVMMLSVKERTKEIGIFSAYPVHSAVYAFSARPRSVKRSGIHRRISGYFLSSRRRDKRVLFAKNISLRINKEAFAAHKFHFAFNSRAASRADAQHADNRGNAYDNAQHCKHAAR